MSKRNRVFIGVVLGYLLGVGFLLYSILVDIDPRYRESAEESLVETSQLMATLIEQQMLRDQAPAGVPDAASMAAMKPLFQSLHARRIEAQIFSLHKTKVELRMTVTDAQGRVLFDSQGVPVGTDHSNWRDVRLTLQGQYGARTSPDVIGNERSSVMYVAAPIRSQDRIVGVVSIGKPVQSFGQFVEAARNKTLLVGLYSVVAVVLLMVILSAWLVRPFGIVTDYLRHLRSQRRFSLPRMSRSMLGLIGAAYDEMRDALAGRSYVADYVQTLTHELKSPLSAIRGAAELLNEDMPEADRQRFLANIARETQRIQELVDRMMELTALESRRSLERRAPVALRPLVNEIAASAQAAAATRKLTIVVEDGPDASVDGDAFLLQRALSNLLDNALDFSPEGGTVRLSLQINRRTVDLRVQDSGPGIPDYAESKVFEKFYSLARPHSRKKSTGLGLSFVSEIAELHEGRITLKNAAAGGAVATLSLPLGA